jgi:uncharacterized protein
MGGRVKEQQIAVTTPIVVSDASPLIALEQIGQLTLFERLFSAIFVPPIVAQEIAPTVARPKWLVVRSLALPLSPVIAQSTLDRGERDAIGLALELRAEQVIFDDRPARRMARALGLSVTGTLGVLLAAKRYGYVPLIRPLIDELLASGFFVGSDIYADILREAGEDK